MRRAGQMAMWAALAAGMVTVMPLAGCGKAPCDPPYHCPQAPDGGVAVVNCMPPNGGAPECAGQCYAWIAESCPNVQFVH